MEIDLRNNPWNPGIPKEPSFLTLDLYRLLSIFSASKAISDNRIASPDTRPVEEATVYGYSIRFFELTEAGRIFTTLAALCRNDWDSRDHTIADKLTECGEKDEVGILTKDLLAPENVGPLRVRESWNKILHGETMNFERSEGPSIYSGFLEPKVHLYGEYNGKSWKATIDVFRWCEVVHALLD